MELDRLLRIRMSYTARLAEEGIEEHAGLTLQQANEHAIFWQRMLVKASDHDRDARHAKGKDKGKGKDYILDYLFFELAVQSLGRARAEMCLGKGKGKGQGQNMTREIDFPATVDEELDTVNVSID